MNKIYRPISFVKISENIENSFLLAYMRNIDSFIKPKINNLYRIATIDKFDENYSFIISISGMLYYQDLYE